MRNARAIVIVACLTACLAPPKPGTATPDMTPTVLIDENGRVYRTTDLAARATFTASADSTFRAVVASYSALGIEPSFVDLEKRTVIRQHMLFRGKFQGRRLSEFFDCGTGQFGPRADDGRVLADLTSHVAPDGAGAALSTTIEASLTANDGVARDAIRCVSQGTIEEQLRREASVRLGIRTDRDR